MNAACDYSNIVIIETVSELKKKGYSKRQMKNNYHTTYMEAKCIQIQNRFYPLTKRA
jgi:hypothetical protein